MSPQQPIKAIGRIPCELPEQLAADIAHLRTLSMEERARRLEAACAAATAIEQGRRQMGLPPVEPTPWPASTIEFLRKHAPNGRKAANS
jgi:hypothetical protein